MVFCLFVFNPFGERREVWGKPAFNVKGKTNVLIEN